MSDYENEEHEEYGSENIPIPPADEHPIIQAEDDDGHKPLNRKASRRGSYANSRRSSRAPSAVEWDDDEREQKHLNDQNAKLKQQVKTLKKTIRGLKEGAGGPISAKHEASIEQLNDESEQYQADIDKYKEKARKVNDIEQLDTLLDTLTQKQIEVKALEIQRRQIGDAKRSNMKTIKMNENTKSRQAVFLELKDERRRQMKQLNKAQERKEKLAEQIQLIKAKAEEAVAKVDELGLNDVDVPSIINMQKKDAEQQKQIEKLRQQIGVCHSSFDAIKTKTGWAERDKEVVLESLREEIEKVRAEINKKEQLIVGNQNMTEKPPHFLEPIKAATTPESPRKVASPRKPRPPPPKKKQEPAQIKPTPPPPKKSTKSGNSKSSGRPGPSETKKSDKQEESARSPTPPSENNYSNSARSSPASAHEEDTYASDYDSPSPAKKDNEKKPDYLSDDADEGGYSDDYNSPSPQKGGKSAGDDDAPIDDSVNPEDEAASPKKSDMDDSIQEEEDKEPAFLTD